MESPLFLPRDQALFTLNLLRRLGHGSVGTFEERLKSQKCQYFAQSMGISPSYSFNLYLKGPYSPDLAHDLYTLKDSPSDVVKFASTELEEKFNKLKSLLKDKSSRQLELCATLHWLLKIVGLNQPKAKQKLIEIKKASDAEFLYAIKEVSVLQ
ncbi:MAG: hypothetical protein AABX82_08175 [Nanoarchaeota archaeon]